MTHQDTPTQPRASATARRLESAAIHLMRSHHSPHKQRRIAPGTTSDNYNGAELGPSTVRPGAMDACDLPSRVGRHLHYRDGRVELVGQP